MTWRPPFTALVTSLFAVWLVAAGLIPATSPRVQAQDTGATLTFTCGTTPAPCEVQPGGTITVTGRAIRVCETFTALELVNVAGVPVTLGTLSFCTSFEPRLFTVPTSVAPGVYTVRLRLLDPPSTVLVTAVQLLTVTGSTGGSLTGIADCGSGGLEGALVELFSGASFVASTIAGRGGAFSFDVAPGQYTVRIKYRGEVCGGPAEPGGEQRFRQTARSAQPLVAARVPNDTGRRHDQGGGDRRAYLLAGSVDVVQVQGHAGQSGDRHVDRRHALDAAA